MANSTQHHDLYIALFARTAIPRTYHWALLTCASNLLPYATSGVRYHVTNSIQTPHTSDSLQLENSKTRIPWRYETQPMATLFTASPLLARILVSRIEGDPELLPIALEAVPLIQDDTGWTCRMWVRDALAALARSRLIELPSDLPAPRVVSLDNGGKCRFSLGDEAWEVVEGSCKAYLDSKHEIGRWRVAAEGRWVEREVPTWDLVKRTEIVA